MQRWADHIRKMINEQPHKYMGSELAGSNTSGDGKGNRDAKNSKR